MTNNQVNPNYQIFEDELQNHPLIKDKIQEKINKRKFSTPIAINKEKHSVEQATKAKEYDNLVANFPDNKIPPNFKELWQSLNNRPNITQEEYGNLKNNQKPTDYEQTKNELNLWHNTFPNQDPQTVKQATEQGKPEGLENLPSNWKDQLAELKLWKETFGEQATPQQVKDKQCKHTEADLKPTDYDETKKKLSDWQTTFPNLEPNQVKAQQGTKLPEGLPTNWKEQLDSIPILQGQLNATNLKPEELKMLVKENWEELWNHVDNLTSLIKRAVVVSKPDLSSEGDKGNSNTNKPPINSENTSDSVSQKPKENLNLSDQISQ